MIYLPLTVFSSTAIYVVFKWAKSYSCKLPVLIAINYIVAAVFCFVFLMRFDASKLVHAGNWLPSAILLGLLFIFMFYLIGNSSQKAGITVTTLANKLSLVFPVFFSLLFFKEEISTVNYIGLASATVAIFLTIYKKDIKKTNLAFILLPLLIFVFSGITDSVVKYAQELKIDESESDTFSFVVFSVAFLCGITLTLLKSKNSFFSWHTPTILLGTLLGLVNFGSLYFLINALNFSNLESSLVFAVINMSIVLLSTLVGGLVFRERLNKLNYAGIVLALLSLYFLL